MKGFMAQAKFYAAYHQKSLTRYIQMISVSLFILSFMVLLGCVHVSIPGVVDVSLAAVAAVCLLIYYARLEWRLTLVITPLVAVLCWVGSLFSMPAPTWFTLCLVVIILVLAFISWYAGFFIEGKYPAWKDNFPQIAIAPLLIAADIFFMAKRMRNLEEDLYGKHAS